MFTQNLGLILTNFYITFDLIFENFEIFFSKTTVLSDYQSKSVWGINRPSSGRKKILSIIYIDLFFLFNNFGYLKIYIPYLIRKKIILFFVLAQKMSLRVKIIIIFEPNRRNIFKHQLSICLKKNQQKKIAKKITKIIHFQRLKIFGT